MKYPTLTEIENASHFELGYWYRFLPSPGTAAIGKKDFDAILKEEKDKLEKIMKRFDEKGGMTTELSKQIGH